MAFWESVKAFFQREASDAREGFESLRDKLDTELTRRETELDATPAERLDMIREDIASDGSVFDEIEDKIDARLSGGESIEELRRHLDAGEEAGVGDDPAGDGDTPEAEPDGPPEELTE